MVNEHGIDTTLLDNIAAQALALQEHNQDLLIVTSGAVKYGRFLAQNGQSQSSHLDKTAAAFLGFEPLMKAWENSWSSLGLLAMTLAMTGQSFTTKNQARFKKMVNGSGHQAVVVNTHDGLNSTRFKHFDVASNNDMVGETLAGLISDRYIICTNVDGVLDNQGRVIRHFESIEQLNDITFHKPASGHGTGGMETKLWAAIRYSLSETNRAAYIVNGRQENVLLKIAAGEEVGTKVQVRKEG